MSRLTFFSVAIIGIICTFCTCKKDNPCPICPPPQVSSVSLSAEDIQCQEVWLKLKFTDNNNPHGFALLRDGVQVASGSLVTSDTLLIDTTVVAGHTYTYTAHRLNISTVVDVSASLPIHTLDSTSHTINWIVDTLGVQGVVRDCWVFSRDNAWAVGDIHTIETDRFDSTGKWVQPFNAARWDGRKWNLMRIIVRLTYQSSQFEADNDPIYSVFAFSQNEIMFLSSAGGVTKYINGNWVLTTIPYGQAPNGLGKMWGTSMNSMFFAGSNGRIIFYDGSAWTKIPSNTTVDLKDIYGLDANHIWIAGANANDGKSVILSFDGTKWNKIYDSDNVPAQEWYDYKSVWMDNSRLLYLASSGLPRKLNLNTMTFTTINTGQTYVSYNTRGIKQNDFFVTGANSEIVHFNGSSWKLYENIQSLTAHDVWWLTIKAKPDFVMAGGGMWIQNLLNDAPVIARGNR